MKIFALILAPWIAFIAGTPCKGDAEYNFLLDSKKYSFQISSKQIEESPKWNPSVNDSPPLLAGKALLKASAFIETIPPLENTRWELTSLNLVPIFDGWMWKAEYSTRRIPVAGDIMSGIRQGRWPTMACWIFMDGTVLQPKVLDPSPRNSFHRSTDAKQNKSDHVR